MTPNEVAALDAVVKRAGMTPDEVVALVIRYHGLGITLDRATSAITAAEDDWKCLKVVHKALQEFILFLGTDPKTWRKGRIRAFALLESALYDIMRGAKPPLLNHARSRGGQPTDTTREYVQAALAWVLELLIGPGEMKPDPAADWVAAEARKAGLTDHRGQAITGKQVMQWRKNIRSRRAPAGTQRQWELQRAVDEALLKMPASELKRERTRQRALTRIRTIADMAPRSAPIFRSKV